MGLGKGLAIGGVLGLGIGAIVAGLITKNAVENKYLFNDDDDDDAEEEKIEIEEDSNDK